MGITTTLENISQKFAEWHNDIKNSGQHDRIYAEIQRQVAALNNAISTNNDNDNYLAQVIQKIFDDADINSISDLHINDLNLNLDSLQKEINTSSKKLKSFSVNTDVKNYIDSSIENVNAQHDDGAQYYNKILTETLILKDIPSQTDLNIYTDIGFYRCTTKEIASSLSHSPVTSPFILITISQYQNTSYNINARNNIVRQILFQNHPGISGDTTTKDDGYRIYQRYYQVKDGIWHDWTELYGTHNTQLVTMGIEFSNGTTQDYVVLTKK